MTRLKLLMATATFAAISVPALSQEGGMKMEEMQGMDTKDMPCCEDMAHGVGVINSINAEAQKINLTHGPIPQIGWGKMTMDFQTGKMVDLTKFETGDRVQFALKQGRDKTHRIMMMCQTDAEDVVEKLCMKDMKKDDMMQHHMMDDEDGDQSGNRSPQEHQH
ncbi:MAG: copper-binding protein [Amphiplicatus sp.]